MNLRNIFEKSIVLISPNWGSETRSKMNECLIVKEKDKFPYLKKKKIFKYGGKSYTIVWIRWL